LGADGEVGEPTTLPNPNRNVRPTTIPIITVTRFTVGAGPTRSAERMFDDRSKVIVSVLMGIVPGQQPCGDRTDGDFGTFNQDQMVRMLVRHATPRHVVPWTASNPRSTGTSALSRP
jgi:hypothetical protein